ncbi:MAG: T9SS type A sorting domain-containing protein [Flavobacteriales bacterium]|nr:T9SS type A sorting domain-containing protein [Flavobacteriales bacterium]
MIKLLIAISLLFSSVASASVAYTLTYSLARNINDNSLQFVSLDLQGSYESLIKTYQPSELDDFNPDIVTFDTDNNLFITEGYINGNAYIIGINAETGNVDYSFASSTYEYFSVESVDGKLYSLTVPYVGGGITLVELDLVNSIETLIKAYAGTEIDNYFSNSTTFDYTNKQFITLAENSIESSDFIAAIDITDGMITSTYISSTFEIFSLEYYSGQIYSLVRPFGGGDISLVAYDLTNSSEAIIASYTSTIFSDYDPSMVTFDLINNSYVVKGNTDVNDKILGIDINNGVINLQYKSTLVNMYSIEAVMVIEAGISDDKTSSSISLFPNPASDMVNILGGSSISSIDIFDILGNNVKSIVGPTSQLGISDLSSGIYLVRITDKGTKSTHKLAVE